MNLPHLVIALAIGTGIIVVALAIGAGLILLASKHPSVFADVIPRLVERLSRLG